MPFEPSGALAECFFNFKRFSVKVKRGLLSRHLDAVDLLRRLEAKIWLLS